MMKRTLILSLLALTAAADGGITILDAGKVDALRQLRAAGIGNEMLKPGKWSRTLKSEVLAPGLPNDLMAKLRAGLGEDEVSQSCVDPAARKTVDRAIFADFFICKIADLKVGNGKFAGNLRCATFGPTVDQTIEGSYSPERIRWRGVEKNSAKSAEGKTFPVEVIYRFEYQWVGVCDPSERG